MTSVLFNSQALPPMHTAIAEPATLPAATLDGFGSIEACYAEFSPRIFRFLLSNLRDRDLAASLTQDTFVRAWAARAQFRGECAVSTWLTRIALNLLRDHTRTDRFRFWKKAAQTSIPAEEMASHLPHRYPSTEAAMIAREQLQLVWAAVEDLSERQRAVFLLRFVEEMELAEIADVTAMPISTVKTHLYRSLAIVRNRQTHPAKRMVAQPKETR